MTRLTYIGPLASKIASGIAFPNGESVPVDARKAKGILRHWPGQFAVTLPCPNCTCPDCVQPTQELQEAVRPIEPEQSVGRRPGRPRKSEV